MKFKTIPAMLAAGALAFTLAGCSGGSQAMTDDTLKGVWSLESQTELGFEAYASFEDENMFEMLLADSYLDGTWSVSGSDGSVVMENENGDEVTVKLSYSNNKLTFGGADGSKLVFVKDDSDEARELFEYDESLADLEGLSGDEGDEGDIVIDADGNETETVDEVITPIDPAVVIADDANSTITVTGKGTDFTGDPCYALSITNKTDKDVYYAADAPFKVGDKEVEPGIADEAEAGETIEVDMYFATDELGGGLEALTTTDGVIVMYDNDTDEVIAQYPFHME